jgi:hypothetical protein
MSFLNRRFRDVDIVSTTNPGKTIADIVVAIEINYQAAEKAFQPLAGAVDGNNNVFVIGEMPDEGSVRFYVNGVLQNPGVGNDYEILNATITTAIAPQALSVIWVSYKVTTPV